MSRCRTIWMIYPSGAVGPMRYDMADMRGAAWAVRRSVAAGANHIVVRVWCNSRFRALAAARRCPCGGWYDPKRSMYHPSEVDGGPLHFQRAARLLRKLGVTLSCTCNDRSRP